MKGLGNKIIKILSTNSDTFSVRLKFADGSVGLVSLEEIFLHPRGLAAEILRGGLFEKCFVLAGALAWPNGFELCPDALKRKIKEQSLSAAALAPRDCLGEDSRLR